MPWPLLAAETVVMTTAAAVRRPTASEIDLGPAPSGVEATQAIEVRVG